MLLPFQPGVVQLACWALDKLREQAGAELPPLCMVPVAVRYHFMRDMLPAIDASLRAIEQRLKLTPDSSLTRYQRLLRAGEYLLAANERTYGLKPAAGDDIETRLASLREAIIRKVADALGMKTPAPELPLRDRLRSLFNAVEQLTDAADDSAYARQLREREAKRGADLYRELDRLLIFVATSGRYVTERPCQERFADVLGRLEREVLGREKIWGPRRALVLVGEPIDIAARYEEYLADKRGFVQQVTLQLEAAVAAMLEATADLQRPFDLNS